MKTGRANEPNPDLWPKAVARVPALEFRRAPLLAAACWFAMGEVMARNWQPAVVLLIATVSSVAADAGRLRWSLRIAIVPLAALWMAMGCWCAEIQPAPSTQQALATYADGLSRQVRGRVVRVRELPPATGGLRSRQRERLVGREGGDEEAAAVGAVSVDIQVDAIEEVTPDISRMVPDDRRRADECDCRQISKRSQRWRFVHGCPALHCGDIVEAPMRIKLPERYRDPGAWQYADYLLAQGIGAHASVRASKIALLRRARM